MVGMNLSDNPNKLFLEFYSDLSTSRKSHRTPGSLPEMAPTSTAVWYPHTPLRFL